MRIALADIGGTAIKSLIYDSGTPFDARPVMEAPTPASAGGEAVLQCLEDILSAEKGLSAIAVSTAGQVDPDRGSIVFATDNIPGYTGMKVRERFESRFAVPVFVENDVNAAALGESAFGAARGLDDFVCLTFGTGIGGALFIGGKLYRGSSFSAAEAGHLITHLGGYACTCGNSGCWEQYASASALVRLVRKETGLSLDGRRIFELMPRDGRIRGLIGRWAQEISAGLASLIHLLNPQAIILGGGVMEQESLIGLIRSATAGRLMPSYRHTRILRAELGNKAGLMGMLHLAEQQLGHQSIQARNFQYDQ